MNDPAFKTAAYAIAEAAPRHLDQPTSPPIRWRAEDDNLVVILADGRIATGPIIDQYRDKVASVKKQAIVPGSSTGAEALTASLPGKVVAPVPDRKPQTSSPKGKKK